MSSFLNSISAIAHAFQEMLGQLQNPLLGHVKIDLQALVELKLG
jgi:hypothetical protein